MATWGEKNLTTAVKRGQSGGGKKGERVYFGPRR